MKLRLANPLPTPYDSVAPEYYDAERHPTCANFGQLSADFLRPHIARAVTASGTRVLEVGSGKSLVAPLMVKAGVSVSRLTLLDISAAMLEHSRQWTLAGARAVVADARDSGLESSQFTLVVASLGDPYNEPSFWREVERLLVIGGECLFTCPSYEWASRFRSANGEHTAEFTLANGSIVGVPSHIPSIELQVRMIESFGLVVKEITDMTTAGIVGRRSSKLDVFGMQDMPTVRGLRVQRL